MSHAQDNIEENQTLLDLLPVEIWVQILDRVDDSTDIRNFIKSWDYPDWDGILHLSKQSWLFDKVFPLIFEYLPTKSQVLTCRLVCKRWSKAVDSFLENNPCHRPVESGSKQIIARAGPLTKQIRDKGLLLATLSPRKINDILNSPQILRRNPILSRAVQFNSSCEEALILAYLSTVGCHIWDFRLEVREHTPLQIFHRVYEKLGYLSNLKRLQVVGDTTLVIETTVASNLRDLQSSQNNLLPTLEFLETLELSVFGQYRDEIVDIFLTNYSASLKRLTVHTYPFKDSNAFTNLTDLTISVDSDKQVDSLLTLGLQRLTVYIVRNSNRGSYPDFRKLFEKVQTCYSKTLQFFSVEFPITYSPLQWSRQESFSWMEFPKLKTIEFKEACFQSFNFICGLTSLEYLHLSKYRWGQRSVLQMHFEVGHIEEEINKEILDLKKILENLSPNGEGKLLESNVWSELPKLIEITLSKAGGNQGEVCLRRTPIFK